MNSSGYGEPHAAAAGRLFQVELAAPCDSCSYIDPCGAAETDQRCPEFWPSPGAGLFELHSGSPSLHIVAAQVGGFAFENVNLVGCSTVSLPTVVGSIRTVRGLRGIRPRSHFTVKLREVWKNGRLRSANEVRARLGLPDACELIVVWYEKDRYLELRDEESAAIIRGLADAGYCAVTTPSFATYKNRTRIEYMKNTKRSLNYAAAFESVGIPAIPTLAPNIENDVKKYVRWLDLNPGIELVGADLTCDLKYRDYSSLPLWRLIDLLTGGRLRYLVNGAASLQSYRVIYSCFDPARTTLTDNRTATMKPAAGYSKAVFFDREIDAKTRDAELAAIESGTNDITIDDLIERESRRRRQPQGPVPPRLIPGQLDLRPLG